MLVAKMGLVRQECIHAWGLINSIVLKKNKLESFQKHKCRS